MMDFGKIVAAVQSSSKEEDNYIKYADEYGMDCNWLHRKFINKISKSIFTLRGMYKKGSLYMIRIEELDGTIRSYNIKHFLDNCVLYQEETEEKE